MSLLQQARIYAGAVPPQQTAAQSGGTANARPAENSANSADNAAENKKTESAADEAKDTAFKSKN